MSTGPTGSAGRGLIVSRLTVRDGSRPIVSDLDLDVASGQRVAITGPSSGDISAILVALAGLRPPTAGTIMVDEQALGPAPPPTRVGYLSQDHRLIGTLTAVENLLVAMIAGGAPANLSTAQQAEAQLEALALAPATWHNLVEQLSGGQQQRVALGRAVVLRPRLLVLDHPTSELDPDSVELVDQVLRDITAAGSCCVLASDDEVVLSGCDARLSLG